MSFYEALYAAQPDDEVNMLKRQWQDGGGLHFNAAMGAEFIPGARNLALALALALVLTLTLALVLTLTLTLTLALTRHAAMPHTTTDPLVCLASAVH